MAKSHFNVWFTVDRLLLTVKVSVFSTYTVSTLTSVRSLFSRRSLLREARVRSVTCTSLRVSPWSFCWRVMVVTSRRVSWTATTTCCQTVSLVTASVRSSRSLLLALRLTLQLVKHRTVRDVLIGSSLFEQHPCLHSAQALTRGIILQAEGVELKHRL